MVSDEISRKSGRGKGERLKKSKGRKESSTR